MSLRQTIKEIQEFVETIKEKNNMQREIAIANKFPEFWDNYPFLVKKLVKDNQDLSMLYTMLGKIEKIDKGELSMTSVEYELGNKLADQYLTPVLKANEDKKD